MSITKRVFGGTALITLARGSVRLLAIFAAPILTAILGPGPYGVMALLTTASSLATTIALLGIDMSYARYFFGENKKTNLAVEQFCWRFALLMSFISALAACLFYWQLGVFADDNGTNGYLLILLGLAIVAGVIRILSETRIRLRGRYKIISIAIFLSGLCGTVSTILLALYWRQDVWPLFVGAVVMVLVNIVILGLPSIKEFTKPFPMDEINRWQIISLGLPGVFTALMYWLQISADKWIIASYVDTRALGIYSFSSNLALVGLMLNSAITLTWFPEATRAHSENKDTAKYILGRLWARLTVGLMIVWLIITIFGGDVLRLLADPQFHSGAKYIPWIAGGVFFYGVSSLANTGLLLSESLKPAAVWWLLAGTLNVSLNIIFIPVGGVLAAAIINFACFAFAAIGVMIVAQRRYALVISWYSLFGIGIIVAVTGMFMNNLWHENYLMSIALKIPFAMITTLVCIRLIAPDWFKRAIEYFRLRLASQQSK